MKLKFLIPITFSIVIGFLFGKIIFSSYDSNTINTFNEGEKVYFVQYGCYNSLAELKKVSSYENYLYLFENNNYCLYSGISKNKEIALKVKEYLAKVSNNIYIQEKYVNNSTFLTNLTEYDKVAAITVSGEDLLSIEKVIISNYKEMVLQE